MGKLFRRHFRWISHIKNNAKVGQMDEKDEDTVNIKSGLNVANIPNYCIFYQKDHVILCV